MCQNSILINIQETIWSEWLDLMVLADLAHFWPGMNAVCTSGPDPEDNIGQASYLIKKKQKNICVWNQMLQQCLLKPECNS